MLQLRQSCETHRYRYRYRCIFLHLLWRLSLCYILIVCTALQPVPQMLLCSCQTFVWPHSTLAWLMFAFPFACYLQFPGRFGSVRRQGLPANRAGYLAHPCQDHRHCGGAFLLQKSQLQVRIVSYRIVYLFIITNAINSPADCLMWAASDLSVRNGYIALRMWQRLFSAWPCRSTIRSCMRTKLRWETTRWYSIQFLSNWV